MARIIQENLFPTQPLIQGEWAISGFCRCAIQVGGDYFDYFPLPDGKLVAIIGDVSGHGTAAALIVGMAKGLIRSKIALLATAPERVLEVINTIFQRQLAGKKFMTLALLIIDPQSQTVSLSNAGHCFPIIIKRGTGAFWAAPNLPLGVRRQVVYHRFEVPFDQIDTLVLYSDGLPEATREDNSQIGFDRFRAEAPQLLGDTPHQSIENMLKWQETLVGGRPFDDDTALVVIQRQSDGSATRDSSTA